MKAGKIQMIEVKDRNRQRENWVSAPICERHNKPMIENGKSTRGLQEFFCLDGLKTERGRGRITKIFRGKAYGFIDIPRGKGIFFHFSNLKGQTKVEEGDLLEFTVGINAKTEEIQAINIRKVREAHNRRKK